MLITHRSSKVVRGLFGVGATLAAAVTVAVSPVSSHPAAQLVTPAHSVSAQGPRTAAPRFELAAATAAQMLSYRHGVKKATNARRASRDLKTLTTSKCLVHYATRWAKHMAATKTMTHQNLGPFLSKCHAYFAAENIAKGKGMSAKEVVHA